MKGRALENQVIDNQKSSLQSYVVCPGHLYGQGESKFYRLFRQTFTNELPGVLS